MVSIVWGHFRVRVRSYEVEDDRRAEAFSTEVGILRDKAPPEELPGRYTWEASVLHPAPTRFGA